MFFLALSKERQAVVREEVSGRTGMRLVDYSEAEQRQPPLRAFSMGKKRVRVVDFSL
jgi:hypothetical protein